MIDTAPEILEELLKPAVKQARTRRPVSTKETERSPVKTISAIVRRTARDVVEEPDESSKANQKLVVIEKNPTVVKPVEKPTPKPKKAEPEEVSFWSDDETEVIVKPRFHVKPNPLVIGRTRATDLTSSIRSHMVAIEGQKQEHLQSEPHPNHRGKG
jgi:hypothetical protein